MVIDGANVTFSLNSNVTVIDTKSVTLKNGFVNLGTYTLTCGFLLSSSGTGYGTRGINFTTSTQTAAINLSWIGSTKTVLDITSGTGFSYTGQSLVRLSGDSTATRTIAVPAYGANDYPLNFEISGSDSVTLTANAVVGKFDFEDFSGTLKSSARYVLDDYIQGFATTIQGGGTASATIFTTNTSQFPDTKIKNINFNGNTAPTLYFTQGRYNVIGDLYGVYTNNGLTTYGNIFFNGASQVDINSAIECRSVIHTSGRVNLYGSFYLYQTAAVVTSPSYLLSGRGAELYMNLAATIDAISAAPGWFVIDFNGTGLFFESTPASSAQISCYMMTYTTYDSFGFSYSGPSNADNREYYQIDLAIDSTTSADVLVWTMPSGVNYLGTGTINVHYGASSVVASGALIVENACPGIGFNFETNKTIRFNSTIMSNLNLMYFTGVFDLNGATLSLTGDFMGSSGYTWINTSAAPTWTMLGNTQTSTSGVVDPAVFLADDFYYPITLNFQSVGEYIIQGTRYESPNPLYLTAGTINVSGSIDYDSPSIIVSSVNLDASNATRKLIHNADGSKFYVTAPSGTVWSSTGPGLTIESNAPGTTVFLDNINAAGTRTINPGFRDEDNSFSIVVNSSTDLVSVLGTVSFIDFVALSAGTLNFSDVTIYGQFQGTAVNGNSIIRMLGQTFGGLSAEVRYYDGYLSGHDGRPINSDVFAGSDALTGSPAYVVMGSDILQNLTVNRAEIDFNSELTTATIGKNLTVTTTAVAASQPNTAVVMPVDIIVGGDIYFGNSAFIDISAPDTITLTRNSSTTSTFEVGQRQFYGTTLIFDNTLGTGTVIILDNSNETVAEYDQSSARLYPGFLDIIASTSTNGAYVKLQSNRNFMLTTYNTFKNINKISSVTSGTQHQLVYYDAVHEFDHFGTKISANVVNTTTYVQDSKMNINYMVFAGRDRDAGNNTGWVFGSLSGVDPSFFFLD
jgi:hypothetical protein